MDLFSFSGYLFTKNVFTHGGKLVLRAINVVERTAEVAAVVEKEVEDGGVDVEWSLSVVDISSVVSGDVPVAVIVV